MNDATLVLTESKSARSDKMASYSHESATDALSKAKSLVMAMWQGTGAATTEQMADYYEVPVDTIKSVVKNNRDELTLDGLRALKGKELKEAKSMLDLASETAQATIWTPRAALRLGMLLRDSEVAKQVRTVLLDTAMQVPLQNDRIRELELQVELTKSQTRQVELVNSMTTLHGLPATLCLLGHKDAIVEVEKPTIEVFDDRDNQQVKYKGQTCAQLKDYMKTRFGISFASGAEVQRVLEEIEKKTGISLLGTTPRRIISSYIPEENSAKAIEFLRNPKNWQMLLGQ